MSLDFSIVDTVPTTVFDTNITHNLTSMAGAAGIYECLWRPEEHGYKQARQIIPLLENAVNAMKSNPAHFKQFDAPNGWGTYERFLPCVERILEACQTNPNGELSASR